MFESKYLVLPGHVDQNQNFKIMDFINLLQDVEGHHICTMDYFINELTQKNAGVFLTSRQVDIIRMPKQYEEIKIITNPYETKSFGGSRNTIIYDKDNNPIIKTNCFGTFTSLEQLRPIRLSQEVIDKHFKSTEPFEMDYLSRKIDQTNLTFIKKSKRITITRMYLDSYNHMNNIYHIGFTDSILPKKFEYNRFRAEYKRGIHLNEIITIHLYKRDNTCYVAIVKNKNNEDCCIVEYQKGEIK